MADTLTPSEAQILYLEADDEIPSVVRRVRESEMARVVLVVPGRSKATSSAIGLRLLARHAAEVGRTLTLVADPAARTLAEEAGIPAFASIAEAQVDPMTRERASPPIPRPLAAMHVVRGEAAVPAAIPVSSGHTPAPRATAADSAPAGVGHYPRIDDTQAVPVVAPPAAVVRRRPSAEPRGRSVSRRATAIGALVGFVILAALVAALLPGATVHMVPTVTDLGPLAYTVSMPAQTESGTLNTISSGPVTGTYDDSTPARGPVVFANYSSERVQVPKGARVSAGDLVFTTDADVTVPRPKGFGEGTTASVNVTAVSKGADGNVAAGAIDTIDDSDVQSSLCPFFLGCPRLVANRNALAGGVTKKGPQVTQADVDNGVARVKEDLRNQLAARIAENADRLYAPASPDENATVIVPKNLVGTKDKSTFNLSGSLQYARRYVTRDQLRQAGIEAVTTDTSHRPARTNVLQSSVVVLPGQLRTSGEQVSADVQVSAGVTPQLDLDQTRARIVGMSPTDATRAMAGMGIASIELWPGWVNDLPRIPFRIDIVIVEPGASPSSLPAASP